MTQSLIFPLLFLTALIITWICFRPALRFARKHDIVDHPNKRKLQDHPIPVFGGVAVAAGIFIPMIYVAVQFGSTSIWYQLVVMCVLLLIGVLDDIYDVPAWIRLMVEVFLIWFFLWGTHAIIEDLHGLFGMTQLISVYMGLPLSIVAGVGIINAINLIDGVDGYSSGYGIVANLLFASVFYIAGDLVPTALSVIVAGALVPFFIHNVFGDRSKMFIGDGGSLLIGMVMVCDVFALLTRETASGVIANHGVGLVALALAILCIPVFDTLRVMTARMLRKRSPLWPDKTHLHHRFIDLGFSHIGTSASIITTNILIVFLWFVAFKAGCSVTCQFWLVVGMGILFTCGFYYGSQWCERRQNRLYKLLCRIGRWTHFEKKGIWRSIQRLLDKGL